jgi:UPF0271 protein
MITIDLNCDLGEGMKNDATLMSHISSCNIACGGHYGDENSIARTLQLALKNNVKAGAHPSFEDHENFGRVFVDISRSRFRESVTQQIHLFQETAKEEGVKMHHIKMHGALYHATANREDFSDWLVELMLEFYPKTILYVAPQSILEQKCQLNGIPYWKEGFADRLYDDDGKLVSRTEPDALITNYQTAARQIEQMVKEQKVTSNKGIETNLCIDTICIHGDNLELTKDLTQLVAQLKSNHISIG